MRLLVNHKDYISLNHIWNLFALPFKHYCFSVRHALFNIHHKSLPLLHETLTSTRGTLLRKDLSFGLASTAGLLHLHLHHPHIDVLHYLTFALTGGTCFEVAALGTTSFALTAVHISIYGKLAVSACVKFFKGCFNVYFVSWTLLSAISTSKFLSVTNKIHTVHIVQLLPPPKCHRVNVLFHHLVLHKPLLSGQI